MAGAAAGLACDRPTEPLLLPPRLTLKRGPPSRSAALGLQPIGLLPALPALQRDGLLYVPLSYRVGEALPLVVLLHGATGSGRGWFGSYAQRADDARVILLAPDSRAYTWDALEGEAFGRDVRFIEAAIASAFDRCHIDATRMSLVGFSDGASYALSLGLANGDLFQKVVAYSPGMIATDVRVGRPAIRILHGVNDFVLPIEQTSRRIVPELRASGYSVTYTEFEGGHEVPSFVSDLGMAWLQGS